MHKEKIIYFGVVYHYLLISVIGGSLKPVKIKFKQLAGSRGSGKDSS